MDNFARELIKSLKDDYTTLAEDGLSSAEFSGYIDSGSYLLNALLSSSMYGGVPNNKVLQITGDSTTGKTYLLLSIMKTFLDQHPNGYVMLYDTESDKFKKMMQDRGIDTKRVVISEPETIQDFRHKVLETLNFYEKVPEEARPKLMLVLDSLGGLSTSKEMEDSAAGKETQDMTRAKMVRSAFRTIRLKMGKLGIPLLMSNHQYETMDLFPQKVPSGGKSVIYVSDSILMLSKAKEKDGNEVIGNTIHFKMFKARLSKENATGDGMLYYDTGLARYWGLVDLGFKQGVFTKEGKSNYVHPTWDKGHSENAIYKNPEKYFNETVMAELELAANREFAYGNTSFPDKEFETDEV